MLPPSQARGQIRANLTMVLTPVTLWMAMCSHLLRAKVVLPGTNSGGKSWADLKTRCVYTVLPSQASFLLYSSQSARHHSSPVWRLRVLPI